MTTTTQTSGKPQQRRVLSGVKTGVVTTDQRDKTRTVLVSYQMRHPKYGKIIARKTKYHVHDPKNDSKSGDVVEIVNCRPVSKTKQWRLVRVIEKSKD